MLLFTIPSLHVFLCFKMFKEQHVRMSLSQTDTKHSNVHPLSSADCERYPTLFRIYVSRTSARMGRAVLEGVGLAPETIEACYCSHPLNEEEAVQAGLNKWAQGHHDDSPTWRVLLDAMKYAGVAHHHCQGLTERLYQKLIGVCVCVFGRGTICYCAS